MKHSAKLDLDNYLPYLVNRVGTIIAEQFGEEALAPYGLSIAMWRVMAVLASNGGQRQIDLAGLTSIDASTLSRLVTRLVGLGVVSRSAEFAAKEKGAAAIAGVRVEELTILKSGLRRIYANMKSRRT